MRDGGSRSGSWSARVERRSGRTEKVKRSAHMSALERTDPEVYEAIENERRRQVEKIELIASENYTSAAVMEGGGSGPPKKKHQGRPRPPLLRRRPGGGSPQQP